MERPHYVSDYFYLGEGDNKVDLMDVYNLADLAISLLSKYDDNSENFIDDSKINECIRLLKAYIDNYVMSNNLNNDNMNNLVNCYNLLNTYLIGRELLFRTIYFKLWNRFLLNKGLSIDMIKAFSKAHDDLKTIELIGTTINKDAIIRNYNDSNSKKK